MDSQPEEVIFDIMLLQKREPRTLPFFVVTGKTPPRNARLLRRVHRLSDVLWPPGKLEIVIEGSTSSPSLLN